MLEGFDGCLVLLNYTHIKRRLELSIAWKKRGTRLIESIASGLVQGCLGSVLFELAWRPWFPQGAFRATHESRSVR